MFSYGSSHIHILYFNQINSYITCSFSIIQQLKLHLVLLSSYTDAMHFNIIHSLSFSIYADFFCHTLFLFFLPIFPSDKSTIINILFLCFSLSVYMYVYIYIHVYMCVYLCKIICVFIYTFISFRSSFHIWRKTCDLCPSEPDLLHLRWSPVPSIYLKTT
jgi:hypothetical protein